MPQQRPGQPSRQPHHASTLDSIEQDIFRLKKALHNTISKYDLDKKDTKKTKKEKAAKKEKVKEVNTDGLGKENKATKAKNNTKIVKLNFNKSTSNTANAFKPKSNTNNPASNYKPIPSLNSKAL